MKRKLLVFTLMLAVLACLFALSISAASYDKSETVTVTLTSGTQECALYDAEGNELVWYTLDGGASVISIKTSDLVFSSTTSLADISLSDGTLLQKHNEKDTNKIVVANLRGMTFKTVTHSGYKATFSNSTIVQYVYLPNTITSFGCNIFQYCTNLKVCDIPSDAVYGIDDANNFVGCTSLKEINLSGCIRFTSSTHSSFSGCASLTKVIFKPENFTSTAFGGSMFKSCPLTQFGEVPGECHIPDTVQTMGNDVFKGSRFTTVYFGAALKSTGYNIFDGNTSLQEVHFNSNLETLGVRPFMDCTSLERVYGLENTKLTNIPIEAFRNTKIKEILLPNTLKTIDQTAFAAYTAVNTTTTKIVLGASFTTFTSYDGFKNFSALKEVYIPAGCTSIPGNVFNSAASDCVFYFTGTKAQLDTLKANTNTNNTAFINAYNQALSVSEFNALTTKSGRYIVYDYNICDAFYKGVHIENLAEGEVDTNLCVLTLCSNCGAKGLDTSSAATHNLDNGVIAYANGFANAGTFTVTCQNAGCVCNTNPDITVVPAIYSCLGFAVKEDGTSLTLGYTFDKEAYESYIANNAENVVSFGFVAYATYDEDSCNPLSVNEGVISPVDSAKTIFASMSVNFAAYDFVIRGFDETTQDLGIAMCAYTYDGSNVKYLCKNTEGVFGAYDVAYATTISKEA